MTVLRSQGPEGSWMVTVTITAGTPQPPFQALITYGAGGGLVETDPGNSPGHGSWVSTGANTFAFTFVNLTFDSTGNPTGTVKVREAATLSQGGDAYSGAGTVDQFDVNGKLITSRSLETQARRILVEPL